MNRSKRRMAADLLKVGLNRVKFDPEQLDRIEEAVTREDIRRLIHSGAIWAEQVKGTSRARKNTLKDKKRLRGKGAGSKKGRKTARMPRKDRWVAQVRVLRGYLKLLKNRGELPPDQLKSLYKKVKGGEIRSMRRMRELIAESRSR
ncbi:MAG TPA: 50S ribosomal protein L19e [Conexivisphaerales archaeon]|nr:50S ribosomal protein L19e [Conexivisphaerales archaeon]